MGERNVLVLNAGSSSLKFALFAGEQRLTGGTLERLSPGFGPSALDTVIERIAPHGGLQSLAAVGHRVVHGGETFVQPTRLDEAAIAALQALEPIDPDHLPAGLSIITALRERAPELPQIACFDTAFHATMPRVARLFGLPRRFEARGIRRYGFHGLSYQFQLEELARVAGPQAVRGRVILAHLGSGSSLAAVKDGQSVDTTMAFTPNSGVVMGTRSGDLDAGLFVHLVRTEKLDVEGLDTMLSKEAGLLGVSGVSADMRDLLEHEARDPACADAVALYCHTVRKAIGALATSIDGLDTLVFAGGVGENAPVIRARVCAGLEHLGIVLHDARNAAGEALVSALPSRVAVRIVRTSEETVIARETLRTAFATADTAATPR